MLDSPAGEASTSFTLPLTADKVENLILKIGRRLSGSVRRIHSSEMSAAKELGGSLFDALFTGAVRDCYTRSIDQVLRDEDAGLRFRLRLQDVPELADLPWEFLLDKGQGRFLAQSAQTPVVRYMEMPQSVRPFTTALPLRILVMISAPVDVPALDLDRERQRLEQALEPLRKQGKVEVTWLEDATLVALMRQLRTQAYHVFQFVGHGAFDPKLDVGLLVLEGEGERAVAVESDKIGAFLRDHPSLRLAVLNSCEGARNSRNDPFAGVAANLVRLGIPAVVAMQFEISDDAAITFSSEFYSALVDGLPVDAAVGEARKAIYATNDVEWATPVLYMRSPNGVLFKLEGLDPTREREAAARERISARAEQLAANAARRSQEERERPDAEAAAAEAKRASEQRRRDRAAAAAAAAAAQRTGRPGPGPGPGPDNSLKKVFLWTGGIFAGLLLIATVVSLIINGPHPVPPPPSPAVSPEPPPPPPPIAGTTYDIPSIRANVQRLRFFESGRDPPARGSRVYNTTFAAAGTRFINIELVLLFPAPTSALSATVPCTFYEPDGTLEGSVDLLVNVGPGETVSWPARGWGAENGGTWNPGAHRAECTFEGKTIAQGSFTVRGTRVAAAPPPPPQPPPPPPPARTTYDIPALRARVNGLQFFEGPFNPPPLESRVYTQRFGRSSTRYIWAQLNLTHPAPGRVVRSDVECVYYHQGSAWARVTLTVELQPDWTSSVHPGGWGWRESGNWPTGTFQVQCTSNGRVIADQSFAVY